MTVTAIVVVAEDDGPPSRPPPGAASFLESLVARLHAEYGVDRDQIQRLAREVLATFASAPVQSFVPILVEKRLRQLYRSAPRPA